MKPAGSPAPLATTAPDACSLSDDRRRKNAATSGSLARTKGKALNTSAGEGARHVGPRLSSALSRSSRGAFSAALSSSSTAPASKRASTKAACFLSTAIVAR